MSRAREHGASRAPSALRWRPIGTWWLNPLVLTLLWVAPAMLLPLSVSSTTFMRDWRTPRFLVGSDTVLVISCLTSLVVGMVLGASRRSGVGARAADGRSGNDRADDSVWLYVAHAGPVLLAVTVAAYAGWFAIGMSRGVPPWDALSAVLHGQGDYKDIKAAFRPVAGVTTFMQVGVPAAAIHVLRWKLGFPRAIRALALLLGLALVRSLLYAERLALIEVALATFVATLTLTVTRVRRTGRQQPESVLKRFAIRSFPVLAPLSLVALFAAEEAIRSWATYYSARGTDFTTFVTERLEGYYATALNNSAFLLHHVPQTGVPRYTLDWLWNFPVLSSLLPYSTVAGPDPTTDWLVQLGQAGNAEFNNPGGLTVYWDLGPLLAPIALGFFGFFLARLHARAKAMDPVAWVAFSCVLVSLLEFPRFFYIGLGRAFPILVVCAYLALRSARLARPERRSVPSPAHVLR